MANCLVADASIDFALAIPGKEDALIVGLLKYPISEFGNLVVGIERSSRMLFHPYLRLVRQEKNLAVLVAKSWLS